MSEVLNNIGIEDYGIQKMVGGGGSTEDLTEVLNAQDTLLENQETKIGQMVQALANKKSIDLQQETADATATAGDITSGKTAYVNGEKITGNMTPATQAVLPNGIIFSGSTCNNFDWLTNVDTSEIERGDYMFGSCTNVVSFPLFDTSNIWSPNYMFSGCTNLVTIPQYNFSGFVRLNYPFQSCPKLSNESLNNILGSLLTATKLVSSDKKLLYVGLSSAQATTCTTLSNWSACQSAGWTTGY